MFVRWSAEMAVSCRLLPTWIMHIVIDDIAIDMQALPLAQCPWQWRVTVASVTVTDKCHSDRSVSQSVSQWQTSVTVTGQCHSQCHSVTVSQCHSVTVSQSQCHTRRVTLAESHSQSHTRRVTLAESHSQSHSQSHTHSHRHSAALTVTVPVTVSVAVRVLDS